MISRRVRILIFPNYFTTSLQTTETGILREVRELDEEGKLYYVMTTEIMDMLRQLVRRGSHAFVSEDLTSRVMMAHLFSETGKA